MATSDARQKVIGLFDKLNELEEEYRAKRDALMAEIAAALGGGEGIGAKLSRLKKTYSDLWQAAYRSGPYQFDHKVDTGHLKRWLVAGFSEDEITARMVAYLRTADPFYVKARHPFLIFVKGFNGFVPMSTAPIEDPSAAATAAKLGGLRGE